jgi:hypothetical protein
VPEFESKPDRFHGPARRVQEGTEHEYNSDSYNWSGSEIFVGSGDSFAWIYGSWTVPHVVGVPGVQVPQHSSAWLGIDGDGGSTDVLQAGTESDADGTHQAWFEWWPDNEHVIANLPVAYGDTMYLVICCAGGGSSTAFVSFANITSKVSTSFTMTAPGGTTLKGNCAEAIVERPTFNGTRTQLPRYGLVDFNDVTALSIKQQWGLGTGTPVTMVNDSGTPISAPLLESGDPDSFVCVYEGP